MAFRLLTTLIFVFTFGGFAHAQTTTTGTMKITGLSEGYSRATGAFFGEANATITTIFGGLSGPNTSCSGSGLCNSCTGNTTGPCNTKRIHDDLQLSITFNYPSGDPGFIRVTNDVNQGGTPNQVEVDTVSKSSNGQVTSGASASYVVTLRWGEICSKVFNGSDCESVTDFTSKRIRVGIDTNNDGFLESGTDNFVNSLQFKLADIGTGLVKLCQEGESGVGSGPCNFIVVAGDSKVFVEDVRAGTGFPSVTDSDADIQAIRIYYSDDGNFPTLATASKDLTVSSASSTSSGGTRNVPLTKNEVTGLINGTTYHFAAAAVDEALNVGFFTDMSGVTGTPAGITDINGGPGACYDPTGADSDNQNCHVATPDEVLGLIEKEFDCFITTATYGSPFRPKVEDFRKFRNTFLHPTWLGRKLIKFYYSTSPPIAKWIRNHPESKPVMRGILYPFWLFAKACLLYPLVTLTTMLLLMTSLFWQWRLRGAKR